MILIGLCGVAGAGKDTAAKFLQDASYVRVALADPVKEAALAIDPYLPTDGGFAKLSELLKFYSWDEAKRRYSSVRQLMQRIGTEMGRQVFGENVWIELAAKRAEKFEKVVITDVRFQNEAQWIVESGGLLIRIERDFDNGVGITHSSESQVQNLPAALTIQNNGSIGQLGEAILIAVDAFELSMSLETARLEAELFNI